MARLTRRRFVQAAGAGGVAAKAGGIAGILATGSAPAYAQATTVHWLRWNDFVPASDQLLRKELLPEAEKALGIKVNLETINGNDLQPRVTAAVQSGSGADLIMVFNNQSALYTESVVDLSDIAEEISGKEGGFYAYSRALTSDGKKFNAMPWTIVGSMNAYRKSWFAEIGVTKFPETWEEYLAVGRKLKAKGRPIGQAVSHSFGDPPTFAYPLLWSFGGKEVSEDGKTVAINSKATVESVKFMTEFWKEACDDGGLAWDDTSNNRAFLAQTIAATLNGASIYIEALRNPDKYITETGAQLKADILHAPLPKGSAGQYGLHTFFSHMLMGYSKNQKPAKDLLRWMHTPANYERWFISQKGFATPPTPQWETHKLWGEDPVMEPYKVAGKLGQAPGFAGPANKKAAEVLTKYLVIDMYAKAIQGMAAQDAVTWAEGELNKVYA
jgi:multiple sugar transport system substrate-binding protein